MPTVRELRDAHAGLSDARGALDAGITWGAIVAVVAFAHAAAHPLAYLAAAAVIGGLQHALVNLAHEAWHRLAFRSRGWNDLAGAWLYSYPIGVPFHHDRERHLRHHRLVGQPEDPDWVNYRNEGRLPAARLLAYLAGRLAGSQLVGTAKSILLDRRPPIAVAPRAGAAEAGPEVRSELLRIAAVQLVLFLGFALFARWWEYLVLWLGPLATFASLFVSIRAFVEHSAASDAVAPQQRLHDFAPGRVEAFFLSPRHFHHHALHHAHPNVPHYRLPAFDRALRAAGHDWPGSREGGYLGLLRRHLARIGSGAGAAVRPEGGH